MEIKYCRVGGLKQQDLFFEVWRREVGNQGQWDWDPSKATREEVFLVCPFLVSGGNIWHS